MPNKDREKQRASWNAWYHKNKDTQLPKLRITRNKLRKIRKEWINSYKEKTPCKDCGTYFPAVCMDFDHLGDKISEVSLMANHNLKMETIELEISKCDVVCSNCHRLRTRNRLAGSLIGRTADFEFVDDGSTPSRPS